MSLMPLPFDFARRRAATRVMRMARARVAASLLALVAVLPTTAHAAPLAGTLTAACVGGVFGCEQVDFFFMLTPPATTVTATGLTLDILGGPFTLASTANQAAAGEAEDAFGPLIFTPSVVGSRVTYAFDPFPAVVAPTLRVRVIFGPNAASTTTGLRASAVLDDAGVPVASATLGATTAVPEPGALGLVAAGLLGIGGVPRLRRRA